MNTCNMTSDYNYTWFIVAVSEGQEDQEPHVVDSKSKQKKQTKSTDVNLGYGTKKKFHQQEIEKI